MSELGMRFVVLPRQTALPGALAHHFKATSDTVGDTTIFCAKGFEADVLDMLDKLLQQHDFVRVFENFWLPSSVSDDARKLLVQSLFANIATQYDTIVTTERNVHCYEHLYAMAIRHLSRVPARVLDFGCGTGLITQAKFASEIETLMGFDFCQRMTSLARNKGLEAANGTIQSLESCAPFELVLASYVFHYGLTSEDWRVLLARVTKRGALFGNFHKSIGLQQALQIIEGLKDSYACEIAESEFGPVLAVFRHTVIASTHV